MLYISNRGNLAGPDLANENTPAYVKATIERGYHVVVDAWLVPNDQGQFQPALGELQPQYPVDIDFLKNPKIIARVKDLGTLQILLDVNVHAVVETNEPSITSKGLIWTGRGTRHVSRGSVMNMPEWYTNNMKDLAHIQCAGICSNFVERIALTREAILKADAEKAAEEKKLDTIPEETKEEPSESFEPVQSVPEPVQSVSKPAPEPDIEDIVEDSGSIKLTLP